MSARKLGQGQALGDGDPHLPTPEQVDDRREVAGQRGAEDEPRRKRRHQRLHRRGGAAAAVLSSPPPTADAAAGQLQKAADALQQPPAGQGGAPALPSTRMELSRQQLVAALEHLPDGKRFDVLYFDEEQETFSPTMATMSPDVRGGAIAFATDVQSGGATAAVDAMRAAYALKAKNIVFLSDGMANVGGTPEEMLDEARAQMKAGVKFFTIGLGNGVREDILSALANESGGTVTLR